MFVQFHAKLYPRGQLLEDRLHLKQVYLRAEIHSSGSIVLKETGGARKYAQFKIKTNKMSVQFPKFSSISSNEVTTVRDSVDRWWLRPIRENIQNKIRLVDNEQQHSSKEP